MTQTSTASKLPRLLTALPGPEAKRVVELDHQYTSPSYTRSYPLVAKRGRGALIEDVDGNTFLDFSAGIAVVATGHCHPEVVAAIQRQAAELIHMSGTDFYYPNMAELAQKLAGDRPGRFSQARLLRQFRHGSGRGGHQAGALSHAPRPRSSPSTAPSTVAPWARSRSRHRRPVQRKGFGALLSGVFHVAVSESLSLPVRAIA